MTSKNFLFNTFFVFFRGRSWLNILYLLLAFPLGIIYFTLLVTGLTLGFGTLIILFGFFVLALTVAGWWLLGAFERQTSTWILGVDIPPMLPPAKPGEDFWLRIKAILTSPVLWTSLLYLLVKFPFGILAFAALALLAGLSLSFLITPLTFWWMPLQVAITWDQVWQVDTPLKALLAFLIGLVVLFLSFHFFNLIAWAWGKFARLMLGNAKYALDSNPSSVISGPAPIIRVVETSPGDRWPTNGDEAPVASNQPSVTRVQSPVDNDRLPVDRDQAPVINVEAANDNFASPETRFAAPEDGTSQDTAAVSDVTEAAGPEAAAEPPAPQPASE